MFSGLLTTKNYPPQMAVLAASYVVLAWLGLSVAVIEGTISPFWPASGLAIAALALWGPRLWPAIAVGAFAANLFIAGIPMAVAAGIAAGNTLEALAGAWVLRRLNVRGEIGSLRDAAVLLTVELLAPIPSVLAGAFSLYLGGMSSWDGLPWVCLVWWVGNSLGAFILLPLVLAWAGQPVPGDFPHRPGEFAGAILLVVMLATLAHFSGHALSKVGIPVIPPAPFIFPPMIWAMLRLRPRDTILVFAIGCACVVVSALARSAGGQNLGPLLFVHMVLMSVGGGWLILFGAIATLTRQRARIRESEQRHQTILDQSISLIYVLDLEGRFTFVNRPLAALFASTPEAIVGRTREAFLPPEIAAEHRANDLDVIRLRSPVTREERNEQSDGTHIYVSVKFPLFDAAGILNAVCGMSTDITDLKRVELERQRFFLLAESSSEFIGMCDLDMQPLYVNPAGIRVVGLPDMAAACRVKVQDYFFPEDQAFIANEFFPLVLREGHGDVEIRLRHFQTGEPIWFFYHLFAVRDDSGRAIGWATVSHDITERRRAEAALRESQTFIKTVLDNLPVGVAANSVDPNIVFDYMNDCFPALYRTTREALEIPGNFWNAAYEDSTYREEIKRRILGDIASGDLGRMHWEDVPITRNGEKTTYINARNIRLPNSSLMISTVWDITERKQAENELANERQLLKTLIQTLPDLIWLKDMNGVYLTCNPRFEQFIGRTETDILGKTDYDLFDKELADFFRDKDRAAINAGEPTMNEEEVTYASDGHRGLLETVKTPMRDIDGKLIGVLGTARDITQRDADEKALRQSEELLDQVGQVARIGGWEMDLATRKARWTHTTYDLVGIPLDQPVPGPDEHIAYYLPEDRPIVIEGMRALIEDDVPLEFEARIEVPGRGVRWFRALGQAEHDQGRCVRVFGTFQDVTEQKAVEAALQESEATIRNKLRAITEPEGDIGTLQLADIIDTEMLQSLMEDFYRLTGMLGAILDLSGKVLVAIGWQDICTKFHRCHPATRKNCVESDTVLTRDVPAGTFRIYHCKNHMWDMVTPLMIGNRHVGNVFIGQFFFEGDTPDLALFRQQARQYGFDESEYIAALERVPRFNRKTVETGMRFYSKLAGVISSLSFSTIQQSRMLAEREQAETALRQAGLEWSQAMDFFTDAISLVDLDDKVIRVNHALIVLTGLSAEQIIGRDISTILHPHGEAVPCPLCRARHAREDAIVTLESNHPDNSTGRPVEVMVRMIRNVAGEPLSVLLAIHDLSREREARRLEFANLRLRELDRLKSLFIASMSHELRTPLNTIIGFTGMLVDDMAGPLSEKQRDYLRRVSRAGKHLFDLITDIIDVSKIEAGKLAVEYEDFALDALLEQAYEEIEPRAREMGLALRVEAPPAGVTLHSDRRRLLQCLLNLLGNAVKYTERGVVKLQAEVEEKELVVRVHDTGIGISEADRDKLFQPFVRLESPLKIATGGTGLGLYLTRKLAQEVLGGEVRLESRPGEGSTFTLRVPLRRTTQKMGEKEVASEETIA